MRLILEFENQNCVVVGGVLLTTNGWAEMRTLFNSGDIPFRYADLVSTRMLNDYCNVLHFIKNLRRREPEISAVDGRCEHSIADAGTAGDGSFGL